MGSTMAIVSAGVSLIAAKQKSDAYKLQAQSYEEQRKQRKIEMQSQVLARERTLFAQMAALRASAASRGGAIGTGGSNAALRLNEQNMAALDVNKIRVMGYSDMRRLSIGSAISRQSAKSAMTSGVAGAIGTIGTGIQNAPGYSAPGSKNVVGAGTTKGFFKSLRSELKI